MYGNGFYFVFIGYFIFFELCIDGMNCKVDLGSVISCRKFLENVRCFR